MIRRIHNRDVNRARKSSPEYCNKTFELPACSLSQTISAANFDKRIAGSSPPAVKGETAPAASPTAAQQPGDQRQDQHDTDFREEQLDVNAAPRRALAAFDFIEPQRRAGPAVADGTLRHRVGPTGTASWAAKPRHRRVLP